MKRNKKKIAQFNHLSKKQLPSPQDELRSIEKSKFKWRIVKEYLDFNHGSFGWKNLHSSEILQVVIPKLHFFEELTWEEASKRKHFHPWKTSKLDEPIRTLAQNRGYESLYQIDIDLETRIFGVKSADCFFCVWYDGGHKGKKMS